jgi:hypothetical protein
VRVDAASRVVGTAAPQLTDVGARREHPAGTGEHEHPGRALELVAQLVQTVHELLIDRVASRGSVEGRHDTIAVLDDPEPLVSHRRAPR